MKTLKIIYAVLLLNTLVVSGYAAGQPVCTKDGVCFEIIVKNSLAPDPLDDEEWGEASFLRRIFRNLKWTLLSDEDKEEARIYHMKRLLRGAKIHVRGKELEVMPGETGGLKESAVILSVDNFYFCTIRVIVGDPQRTFDLTVRKFNDMGLVVSDVTEIKKADEPTQLPLPPGLLTNDELELLLPLSIDLKPQYFDGVEFKLLGNAETVALATNLEQLMKEKGLKILVNKQKFELMVNYGLDSRAVVRSIEQNKCIARVASEALKRIFDLTILVAGTDVEISNIKEVSKKEYIRDVAEKTGF